MTLNISGLYFEDKEVESFYVVHLVDANVDIPLKGFSLDEVLKIKQLYSKIGILPYMNNNISDNEILESMEEVNKVLYQGIAEKAKEEYEEFRTYKNFLIHTTPRDKDIISLGLIIATYGVNLELPYTCENVVPDDDGENKTCGHNGEFSISLEELTKKLQKPNDSAPFYIVKKRSGIYIVIEDRDGKKEVVYYNDKEFEKLENKPKSYDYLEFGPITLFDIKVYANLYDLVNVNKTALADSDFSNIYMLLKSIKSVKNGKTEEIIKYKHPTTLYRELSGLHPKALTLILKALYKVEDEELFNTVINFTLTFEGKCEKCGGDVIIPVQPYLLFFRILYKESTGDVV